MDAQIRIVMATDVPFWKAKTGAEQRMSSLVNFFSNPPFEIKTFYLGQVTPEDQAAIRAGGLSPKRICPAKDQAGSNLMGNDSGKRHEGLGKGAKPLDVVFFESEKPPADFLSRVKWYADATSRQIRKWMSKDRSKSGERTETTDPISPLTLADYRWPWAIDQFRRMCERFRPQVFLAQYVTMAYLLEGLPAKDRRHIVTALDTHDILHERGMQFGSAGYLHWLEIDAETEVQVWNQFDLVLAIQGNEAELIRGMAKNPKTIVVGHAPNPVNLERVPAARDQIRVGYIGSANYSNWHALNRFLIEVWPELVASFDDRVQLVIAGGICKWFELMETSRRESLLENQVHLLGEVDSLNDFYSQIEIAVNPVQFGTGLKIKNVEALAFGCPLVTTESGVSGMTTESRNCLVVVKNFPEMAQQLVELVRSPDLREQLSRKGLDLAVRELSEQSVYSELARILANSEKLDSQRLTVR